MLLGKKLFPMVANLNKNNKGFTLLELVLGIAIILVLVSFLYGGYSSYRKYICKSNMLIIAKTLALDIAHVQQLTSRNVLALSIIINPDKNGYNYMERLNVRRRIVFREDPSIYFTDGSMVKVSFTGNGAPQATGSFKLGSKDLPGYQILIEVQPVNGRVVIREI